jgi:molybdopterin-containing oxidoreductase family iron-sulfur binding subunit
VRRFNWFNYPHNDLVLNLALNPEVTVRTRGIMEKCSMCIQRIETKKIEVKIADRRIVDGEIKTACQESCPADAIVFGDINDPKTRISKVRLNPRRYQVLEEVKNLPVVSYLTKVRNLEEKGEPAHHG